MSPIGARAVIDRGSRELISVGVMTQAFVVGPEPSAGAWRVLAGGARTGGQVVFGEARLAPRSPRPSLHVHTREDESAFVTEGVLTVRVGDRTFEAGPGHLVRLPRGEPRTFANLGNSLVRVFGVTTPAGLEGMFEEQASYFADLTGPPDEEAVAAIGARYGVTVVGPGLLGGSRPAGAADQERETPSR